MLHGVPLVEPVIVPEVFIDGIARIDRIGPNLKLCFFTIQTSASGETEAVVVARFVMSAEAVASASLLAMAATDTVVAVERH